MRAIDDMLSQRPVNQDAVDEHKKRMLEHLRDNGADVRRDAETVYLESVPGMVKSVREAREEGPGAASEALDW